MEFAEYEAAAGKTAKFAQDDMQYKLMLLSMGLAGESGEAIDKIKKLIDYDDGSEFAEEKKKLLVSELGDVLWYLTQLAVHLGSSLEDVAKANIAKLADRAARGVVTKGAGDNR
ncbi:MAG TPA: nucleoside triphosphate pyrophosphohydrolase family protein [Candidatus Paceibacterota bacterium]|nr:nucleoside triphosphate pyrophosphohydrolase family protein [Candidatus Paceibacterota bacterium]